MAQWTTKTIIYEINTWVWLDTLSRQYQREINLWNVPDEVLDWLAAHHLDVIWLMGIWTRSRAARASALNYKHEYKPVLPDLTDDDVIGSAYAIGAYEVEPRIGGRDGLSSLRERLRQRGMQLILDFVPNHVATDHPWVTHKPHYLVRGTKKDQQIAHDLFFETVNPKGQRLIIAHGRDPYFPGWIDTAQLNAFSLELREALRNTLLDIAAQCDGVRCDMAMLMVNDIFARTWGVYLSESAPETEFWEDIIPVVKAAYPDFKFIAEVYWDMEYILLQMGFDMTYDKRLYDRVQDGHIPAIREHLHAALSYQERQVRFIENHDEHRAATSLGIEKGRAAATLVCTLPGATLLHDGQFIGRRVKLPVQIRRQPDEPGHYALAGFYYKLLKETAAMIYKEGTWRLFEIIPPYEGNGSHAGLLAYGWACEDEFRIIIVNLTPVWSQGIVQIYGWDRIRLGYWRLLDVLSGVLTVRDGNRMADEGLYVELEAYQSQIFRCDKLNGSTDVENLRRFIEI